VTSESGGKRAWLGRVQGHFAAISRTVIRLWVRQKNFAKVFQKHVVAEKILPHAWDSNLKSGASSTSQAISSARPVH
jgi:hypothetical protein